MKGKAYLLQPWWLVVMTIALLHQILQKIFHVYIPWVKDYLDPLLLMPILLHLIACERKLFFNRKFSSLSILDIMIITVFISLVTEIIFPMLNKNFYSDIYDVLCYGIGSFIYYLLRTRDST